MNITNDFHNCTKSTAERRRWIAGQQHPDGSNSPIRDSTHAMLAGDGGGVCLFVCGKGGWSTETEEECLEYLDHLYAEKPRVIHVRRSLHNSKGGVPRQWISRVLAQETN